jgi:NitT/TauT family transport system substrate-binding protein
MVLVITISLFVYLDSQKPYTGKVESITVGTVPNEAYSLILIANDQQYFMANGLNVTFKNYISGLNAVEGMLAGESDIATSAEFVFVQHITQNESIYDIGNIAQYQSIHVVGRTDKGINNATDLIGKTIGVALGTSTQFFLGRFLELNGIKASQVIILDVPPNEQLDAIVNGTVDAIISTNPYINQIESRLSNTTVDLSAQAGQPGYSLTLCTKTWAAAHPELIVRFLKALVQAENFCINHPEQAMAILEKELNYTSEYLTSVWKNYRFSVTLDQSFVLLAEDEARWLITNNLTTASSAPNILNYVYETGLLAVKPQAVSIIG